MSFTALSHINANLPQLKFHQIWLRLSLSNQASILPCNFFLAYVKKLGGLSKSPKQKALNQLKSLSGQGTNILQSYSDQKTPNLDIFELFS